MDAQKDDPYIQTLRKNWDERDKTFTPEGDKKQFEETKKTWTPGSPTARRAATRPSAPARPAAQKPELSANLFNAMINPLVPFAIRGAIWYPGRRQ